ncbi:alpha/beta fold hydrolase [Patescibacteria group bacterium]|nr:alpha/beta fold hydrolase [Patescibacteria group bacterium]MBU1705635.1 alpha/beta fold hydrolase [Patescibacteria group bacterium]
METIALTTADHLTIIGDYYPAQGNKFAILLHMMPATKESWRPFAGKLVNAGYACLAIDERGHGASTQGGELRYREFSPEQQQAKILDVNAACDYLKTQGAIEAEIVCIGASIGANLSLQWLKEHPQSKAAIALSPGLDYHGVLTEPAIAGLAPGQLAILVASEEDTMSFKSNQRLHELNPAQTKVFAFSGLGHGTTITDNKPAFIDELIQVLETQLK